MDDMLRQKTKKGTVKNTDDGTRFAPVAGKQVGQADKLLAREGEPWIFQLVFKSVSRSFDGCRNKRKRYSPVKK